MMTGGDKLFFIVLGVTVGIALALLIIGTFHINPYEVLR